MTTKMVSSGDKSGAQIPRSRAVRPPELAQRQAAPLQAAQFQVAQSQAAQFQVARHVRPTAHPEESV